jgi:hypothetical protein
MAESIGRALGLDPDKVPPELARNMQTLREQISARKPPPLEESRIPATGEWEE